MILDGHIHITETNINPVDLLSRMKTIGIEGGVVVSLPPSAFPYLAPILPAQDRLENLLGWVKNAANLFPFFWIDPLEADAPAHVEMALNRGVQGFKVICNHFYPGDERALKVYQAIAAANRPILFHSGILYDGQFSSKYNYPREFEALLDVRGLRFALAHIAWPWCDECIAIYGKFRNARGTRPGLAVEMFIDLTPGTPPIYRKDVLTKLLTVGFELETNMLFGSDNLASNYSPQGVNVIITRDNAIYKDLGLAPSALGKIYAENLKRFLGLK